MMKKESIIFEDTIKVYNVDGSTKSDVTAKSGDEIEYHRNGFRGKSTATIDAFSTDKPKHVLIYPSGLGSKRHWIPKEAIAYAYRNNVKLT